MMQQLHTSAPKGVFCSAAEAAMVLGVSAPTVRKLVREGMLGAFLPYPGAKKSLLYSYEVHLFARRQRQQSEEAVAERIRAIKEELRQFE